jgi:4'-phosphopantetheinyl transferase
MADLEIPEVKEASLDTVPDELIPGSAHLWQRGLHASEDEIQACHELLLPEEHEKASRYRVERPRGDYILTRGTLRSLLSKYLHMNPKEITFRYTKYGKPFLANSDLYFNISHTDGLALLAFLRKREVGVDVERVRPQSDVLKIAERFFSERERRDLRSLTGEEVHAAFFRCWTRKEAYIKAVGEGLSLPLHQFDVSIEPDPKQALRATRPDTTEAKRWSIYNVSVPRGYAAALAIGEEKK